MSRLCKEKGFLPLAEGVLLPAAEFRLFADTGFQKEHLTDLRRDALIRAGEQALDRPYRTLDASQYMKFVRSGNRSDFEDLYFERRILTVTFALAELAERKGRFTDRLIDGVWHILEESTWILPAHYRPDAAHAGSPLPDAFSTSDGDEIRQIDLFSAATGGQLAWIYTLCREILDCEAPIICERILSLLRQRILHPFFTCNHEWWMGASGNTLNNWTPWICSNVLTVLALCETDDERRRAGTEKCMVILDRFLGPYPEDGGCDEGAGYWHVAAASVFDCAELLYDLSGGKIDLFDAPLLRRMCEYIADFSIGPRTFLNFADAPSRLCPDVYVISRMGRRLGSEKLSAFAASAADPMPSLAADEGNLCRSYRHFRNLTETVVPSGRFAPAPVTWYPDLQVSITRADGMLLAFKGGTNGESHNHNDVGEFVLFDRLTPVIMDAGVETYCRDTFSSRRYTLWPMRGNYHNIAAVAGIEQQAGLSYHAETVSHDPESGALTLELKHAYPADAHIETYQRSAALADGTAVIREHLRLTVPAPVVFHFLTCDRPSFDGDCVCFSSGHKMTADPRFAFSVEEIPLNGGKISREWKRDSLFRISLTAKEPLSALDCTWVFSRT